MRHIETSATKVNSVKKTAKTIKTKRGITHAEALEAAAVVHGYENWHHVVSCASKPDTATLNLLSILSEASKVYRSEPWALASKINAEDELRVLRKGPLEKFVELFWPTIAGHRNLNFLKVGLSSGSQFSEVIGGIVIEPAGERINTQVLPPTAYAERTMWPNEMSILIDSGLRKEEEAGVYLECDFEHHATLALLKLMSPRKGANHELNELLTRYMGDEVAGAGIQFTMSDDQSDHEETCYSSFSEFKQNLPVIQRRLRGKDLDRYDCSFKWVKRYAMKSIKMDDVCEGIIVMLNIFSAVTPRVENISEEEVMAIRERVMIPPIALTRSEFGPNIEDAATPPNGYRPRRSSK